jgi:Protein of unknown function (DUF3037)
MAHIYKYSVVTAIPDIRRGERVNVGAVVFRPEDKEAPVDIRMPGVNKLHSLSPSSWSNYAALFSKRIASRYFADVDPQEFVKHIAEVEAVFKLSQPGWFAADTNDAYENQVNGVLSDLVVPVALSLPNEELDKPKPSKINSEIALEFRRLNILAKRNESVEDGRVKRDHYVSQAKNIRADFVARNGVYHVTSTLDLRSARVNVKEAGWKAFVLIEALAAFGGSTKRFGVYAANDPSPFDSHIQILKEHAPGGVYNWLNPGEQWQYRQAMIAAVQHSPGQTPLGT